MNVRVPIKIVFFFYDFTYLRLRAARFEKSR
jgi:hypothetical protein